MIREATIEDIPVLVKMSAAMQQESPRYQHVSFNANVMGNFLTGMIESPDRCVFVAEDDGAVVGMFGGVMGQYFFSLDTNYACDIGLYVVPEMRGRRHAYALLKEYEKWALGKGISPMNITISVAASNDAKVHEFFTRLGFVHIGGLYRKED